MDDEFWKNNGSTILVGIIMLVLGAILTDPIKALFKKIGTDKRHKQIRGYRGAAIYHDNGDAGIFGLLENVIPTCFDQRRNANYIDLLSNERANSLDLIFLFLLGVRELQLDAQLRRRFLHRRGIGRAPFTLRAELGIADDQIFVGLLGFGA